MRYHLVMMKKIVTQFLLFALAACGAPATPTIDSLQPGESVSGMLARTMVDTNEADSMFNFCDPFFGINPPVEFFTDCNLPQMKNLFVGYGDFGTSQEDLERRWNEQTWELYINGRPVDLEAFGTFDLNVAGNPARVWNIMLEDVSPGFHQVRYVRRSVADPTLAVDITWKFTLVDATPAPTSPPPASSQTYPVLTSAFTPGLNPFHSDKADLNFMFYVPTGYAKDPAQPFPLMLYLHGIGLRGSDLNMLRYGELTAILQYEADLPFLVIAPQMPYTEQNKFWSEDAMVQALFTLIEEVQENYAVDEKRLYLTGTSLGAGGTWEIGLRYPQKFAALAPVMGFYGYPFEVPANICDLKDTPIWAFHGDRDLTVPLRAEQGLVDALRACGGDVQFTVYEGAGHDVDGRAYKLPELFAWLSAQTLP